MKLMIDLLDKGSRLAIIDLKSQSLLIPPTAVTGDFDQKERLKTLIESVQQRDGTLIDVPPALSKAAEVLHDSSRRPGKGAIILLVDGFGAAHDSTDIPSLAAQTLATLSQNGVEVYTVALTDLKTIPSLNAIVSAIGASVQPTLCEFYGASSSDIVYSVLQIINRLQGYLSPVSRLTDQREEKTPILLFDPQDTQVAFQFTFDGNQPVNITLKDALSNDIYPLAQEDVYQLYKIEGPSLGWQQLIIRNDQGNRIRQTISVRRDESIDVAKLRFKPLQASYTWNKAIPIEVEVIEANRLVPQIFVDVVSSIGVERLQLRTRKKPFTYEYQYWPAKLTDTYRLIIAPNPQYVSDVPLQTIQVIPPPSFPVQLPVLLWVVLPAGGVVAGALIWRNFARNRRGRDAGNSEFAPKRKLSQSARPVPSGALGFVEGDNVSSGAQLGRELVKQEAPFEEATDGLIDSSLGIADLDFDEDDDVEDAPLNVDGEVIVDLFVEVPQSTPQRQSAGSPAENEAIGEAIADSRVKVRFEDLTKASITDMIEQADAPTVEDGFDDLTAESAPNSDVEDDIAAIRKRVEQNSGETQPDRPATDDAAVFLGQLNQSSEADEVDEMLSNADARAFFDVDDEGAIKDIFSELSELTTETGALEAADTSRSPFARESALQETDNETEVSVSDNDSEVSIEDLLKPIANPGKGGADATTPVTGNMLETLIKSNRPARATEKGVPQGQLSLPREEADAPAQAAFSQKPDANPLPNAPNRKESSSTIDLILMELLKQIEQLKEQG